SRRDPIAADISMTQVSAQNAPASFLGITTFRGPGGGNWTWYPYRDTGFNATYVTGAHAFKAGMEYNWGWTDRWTTANLAGPISSYRINYATGVPVANQFTVNLGPVRRIDRARADAAVFVQDKWTRNRIT